jgi:hypothetical protein
MSWDELLDITPGMFLALNKQRTEAEKARMMAFKFLATVTAQSQGAKVNFMDDDPESGGKVTSIDDAEPYFRALAERQRG